VYCKPFFVAFDSELAKLSRHTVDVEDKLRCMLAVVKRMTSVPVLVAVMFSVCSHSAAGVHSSEDTTAISDAVRSFQSALSGTLRSLESLEQTFVSAHGNAQVMLVVCSVNGLL